MGFGQEFREKLAKNDQNGIPFYREKSVYVIKIKKIIQKCYLHFFDGFGAKTRKFVPAANPQISEIPPVLEHKLELEALLLAFGSTDGT